MENIELALDKIGCSSVVMNQDIKTLFEPLKDNVSICSYNPAEGSLFLEIELPHGLFLDKDIIAKYFRKDAEMRVSRGKINAFRGTIINPELSFVIHRILSQ